MIAGVVAVIAASGDAVAGGDSAIVASVALQFTVAEVGIMLTSSALDVVSN